MGIYALELDFSIELYPGMQQRGYASHSHRGAHVATSREMAFCLRVLGQSIDYEPLKNTSSSYPYSRMPSCYQLP
jgi:hypothetical protein